MVFEHCESVCILFVCLFYFCLFVLLRFVLFCFVFLFIYMCNISCSLLPYTVSNDCNPWIQSVPDRTVISNKNIRGTGITQR